MQSRTQQSSPFAALLLAAIGLACSPEAPAPALEEVTPAPDTVTAAPAAKPLEPAPRTPERVPDSRIEYARLDGEIISKEMFDNEVNFIKKQRQATAYMLQQTTGKRARPPKLSEGERKAILRTMLDLRLTVLLARRDGITVSKAEIDAIIDRDRQTDQGYRDYLNWHQLTEAQLHGRIREREMGERFIEAHSRECVVTPEQLLTEYERLKAEGKMEGKAGVGFWQILAKVDVGAGEPAWDAARAKLDMARERLAAGEDFAAVAREVSEDPNAAKNGGFQQGVPMGLLPPEMEKAVFAIPVGEVSEPIRASYGWHLVKVKERRDEGTRSYEQAAEPLRESMISKCRSQALIKILEQARKDFHAEILVNPGPE